MTHIFLLKIFKGYYFNPSGMTSLQITPQKCMKGDPVWAFLSSTLCQESDVRLDEAETSMTVGRKTQSQKTQAVTLSLCNVEMSVSRQAFT